MNVERLEGRETPAGLLKLTFADAPLLRDAAPAILAAARAIDRTLEPAAGRSAEWRVYVEAVPLAGRYGEGAPFGQPAGFDAVIRLNSNVRWHSGATVAGLEPGEIDIFSAAGHELVHALGVLAHSGGGGFNKTAVPAGERTLPNAADFARLAEVGWVGGVPVEPAVRLVSVERPEGGARLLAVAPGQTPVVVGDFPFHVIVGDFDGDGRYEIRLATPRPGFDAVLDLDGRVLGVATTAGADRVLFGGVP